MTFDRTARRFCVAALWTLTAAGTLAADAPYAWVQGTSVQGGIGGIMWDYGDNLPGVTADTMALAMPNYSDPGQLATTAWASADVSTWQVDLANSHSSWAGFPDLTASASLRDVFTVTDASGTHADGTAATGLWMDVQMQGILFTGLDGGAGAAVSTHWFGSAAYHLQSDGAFSGPDADQQVLVNTGQGYLAQIDHVLALDLCAWGCPSYGVPFDLGYDPTMGFSVSGYSRDGLSYGGDFSFAIAFRSTATAADLRVSSLGGFMQPVPEPQTLVLMFAGLAVLGSRLRLQR